MAKASAAAQGEGMHAVTVPLGEGVQKWSPEHPALYTLRVSLLGAGGRLLDQRITHWGLREFTSHDRRFYLNGEPVQLRGGTVVWHRFLRNPLAPQIAWNADWFQKNIDLRLKGYGANFMRFHLGLPPERLLDLCDRDGLMVQMEWPFFHASRRRTQACASSGRRGWMWRCAIPAW